MFANIFKFIIAIPQYVLVFISSFLIATTRLLNEDLLWLRDYFRTLSSWDCLGFMILLTIYVLLWRTALGFLAWLFKILLVRFGFVGKIEWLDNFLAKAVLKTPVYSDSYSAGYIAGEAQRKKEEEEERKKREEEAARLAAEKQRLEEEKRKRLEDKVARYEAEREAEQNKSWWQKLWPF